jgi:CRP-like cAMP-binding protein
MDTFGTVADGGGPGAIITAMARKSRPAFDLQGLSSAGAARRVVEFQRKKRIFAQGDPANAVFYIQEGAVRLTVISAGGKEAVVGMMGPGDFCSASSSTTGASRSTKPC